MNWQCSAAQDIREKKEKKLPSEDGFQLNRLCLFLQFVSTEIKAKHAPETQSFSLCGASNHSITDTDDFTFYHAYLMGGVLQNGTHNFDTCVCAFAGADRHIFYRYCSQNNHNLEQKRCINIDVLCIDITSFGNNPMLLQGVGINVEKSVCFLQELPVPHLLFSICLSLLLLLYCALDLVNVRKLSHGACQNPS